MTSKMGEADGDAQPPSYIESVRKTSISEHRSQLLQYISLLPEAIRHSQYEYKSRQDEQDLNHVSRLVPEVGAFLTYIATLPQQPPRAELVMVPESAVAERWTLSGSEEQRKEGEVVQVARIRGEAKGACGRDAKGKKGDSPPYEAGGSTAKTAGAEFDEWGRWPDSSASLAINNDIGSRSGSGSGSSRDCGSSPGWWWQDEELARRLAANLSPPRVVGRNADSQPATVAVVTSRRSGQKKAGSWLPWNTSRGKQTVASTPAFKKEKTVEAAETVSVTVRAEEVTFRQQNKLGIYESLTGWGIVLLVSFA